jgi:hypothetical protein
MSDLYPKTKAKMLQGQINLLTDVVRVVLVDTNTYTYDPAHEAFDELSGLVGSPSAPFASKTVSDLAIFDAENSILETVVGAESEALVIYIDSGTPATDWLVAYIDSGNGLPVIPNGEDIDLVWNATGIFSL